MRIKIDAFDTLYFRDGKPFTMGAETWGSGIFPPHPSMLYGALRSAYFSHNTQALKDANTANDPTRDLKITGFHLMNNNEIYFPAPFDCVKEKDANNKRAFILKPKECSIISSCPTSQILMLDGERKIENIPDAWLNESSFQSYLMCDESNISFTELNSLVISEPKIGIGRSNVTHTAQDAMLYRVAMKRMKDTSLIVEFDGLNNELPQSSIMKLGGEGRPVHYESIKDISIKAPKISGKIFKLYLSTPAIFKNGWLPAWIDGKNLEGQYRDLQLKLITSSIGRVVYIGGFDIKAGEPKPMRRAVPAGSVYYFEILSNAQGLSPIDIFHGRAISDFAPEQGFGIAYVGAVK